MSDVPRMSRDSAQRPGATTRGRRVAQVLGIARRHHLLPWSRLDFSDNAATSAKRTQQAQELRVALEEAGGGFVKIGQLFSTRNDLLPAEWTASLAKLQHHVAPASWPDIRGVVEREIGGPIESRFRSFDEVPVSSASIGQVHRATLTAGIEVAVKVQRPGIEPIVRGDVDIALRFMALLTRTSAAAREAGLRDVAQQYADDLLRQLDFDLERRNLAAIQEVEDRSVRSGDVRLPYVFSELSTSRLLVMEFLEGSTLASLIADGPRPDLEPAMRTVMRSFLRQLIFDGVFHSDLHPGNLMITPDGRPAYVDFGSIGRLDSELRAATQEIVSAFLQEDNQRIADALLELAPLRPGADERAFRRVFSDFLTVELGPGARISVGTVDSLLEVITPFGMTAPVELVAAARAFAIFEGTLRTVVPSIDVLEEVRSLAMEQISDQFTVPNLAQSAVRQLMSAVPGIRRFPRRVERITQSLENGDLNVNIRLLADPRDRLLLRGLVWQFVMSAIGVVAGVVGVGFLTSPEHTGLISSWVAGVVLTAGGVALLVATFVYAMVLRRRG